MTSPGGRSGGTKRPFLKLPRGDLAKGRGGANDVVGVLAGRQLDKTQGPVGTEQRKRACRGADRGLAPGGIAVEAQDRGGIEAPQPLELAFRERGAVGRDDFGDPGAVEG